MFESSIYKDSGFLMSTYSFSNISYCVVWSLMTSEHFQRERGVEMTK